MTDRHIENLCDRLQFVAASIPEPHSAHVHTAAVRILAMCEAGERMADLLSAILRRDTITPADIIDALGGWAQAQ